MESNTIMVKCRAYKLMRSALIILGIGIAYYLFVRLTGWGIPCVFHLITDKYCPGCGITRMFMALFRGDINEALQYNVLVMILLPLSVVPATTYTVRYIKNGSKEMNRFEEIFVVIAFVITMAYWIMRNTEAFAWMSPVGA